MSKFIEILTEFPLKMEVSHVFKTCVYFLLNRQQSSTTLINNNHPRISLISPFHELGYLLKLCSNLLAHLVSLVIFKNKFSFLKTLFSKNIKFHKKFTKSLTRSLLLEDLSMLSVDLKIYKWYFRETNCKTKPCFKTGSFMN